MLLSGSTKSSSAASRHRPCCPQRRPPRCCFGRCSPPVRSPCARSMVGGPFPRSSPLNALTSQLDPISSVFRRHRQPSFHTIRDGTQLMIFPDRLSEDYRLFQQFMKVPTGDGEARRGLFKANPDLQVARHGFLIGRNHPDDVEGMIRLFKKFSETYYIGRAIAIWSEAEPIALELISIGNELHGEIDSASPSQEHINGLLASIRPLNGRLTE